MKFFACLPIFACRGKVDNLDYSCQKLENIPDVVFKHGKNLEDLNLAMNNIIELPLGLFKMHKMQRLILSNNRIAEVPPYIGDLKYLVELDISNNEICDIPEEIEKCQHLMVLDVSHNILPGSLPKAIVNLSQLTHLNINDNSVTTLPADIDKLVNLKCLDARECDLRDLPAAIVKLKNLQKLDLGENNLTRLPEKLGELENLKEIDLEKNQLIVLPNDLLLCKNLESLVICNNNLTELPMDIGQLTKLTELNANENELSVIPSSIRLLTNLRILKITQNSIQDVPQSVGSLTSLKELYLSRNAIISLPSSIGNLKNLEFLDVCENQLTAVPSTIGSASKLGTLLLRRNQLKEIPEEIGRLSSLRVLDISENKLSYLPYTLVALVETMRAIYIVPGKPTKVSSLKEGAKDRFNLKTLTCYDLPQEDMKDASQLPEKKSTTSGARVTFGAEFLDSTDPETSQEERQAVGNFERYGTPHPKHFAPKNQQKLIQIQAAKRNSRDMTGEVAPTAEPEELEPIQMRPLRSVLKRRPQSTASLKDEAKTCIIRKSEEGFGFKLCGGIDSIEPFREHDFGFFISDVSDNGPAQQAGVVQGDKILAVNGQPVTGLSHGQCSSLIQDGGLVELRLEPEVPPAEILEEEAPIQSTAIPLTPAAAVPAVVQPSSIAPSLPPQKSSPESAQKPAMSTDVISVTFKCDINGDPGFTVNGSSSGPICINHIKPHGPANQTRMLKHGDRLLSINGKNVNKSSLEQVRNILRANPNDLDLYLIVERIHFRSTSDLTKSLLTPSRSMPSLFCPELLEEPRTSAFVPFSRTPQQSLAFCHKRKPSAEFKVVPPGTRPVNSNTAFLVELSREPASAFGPNRAKSFGNLALGVDSPTSFSESIASTSRASQITSPTAEKPSGEKPSQLRQPTVVSLKNAPVETTSTSPLPNGSSTPVPPAAPVTRIPQVSRIPPQVAPKPKLEMSTSDPVQPPQKPEKMDFTSKRQMFEYSSSHAPSTQNGTKIPPPKKPLISSNDLIRLKEDQSRRSSTKVPKIAQSPEEESGYVASPSGDYEERLNNIVTPTMPQVIRTKKAEIRAAAASGGANSPTPSTASANGMQRSDSATSGRISINLDESEIKKQRRWRSERNRSLDNVQKDADEIITQYTQISQLSNISEPIPTN